MANKFLRGLIRLCGVVIALGLAWAWIVAVMYSVAQTWFPSLDFAAWARSLLIGMFYIGSTIALIVAFAGLGPNRRRHGEQHND